MTYLGRARIGHAALGIAGAAVAACGASSGSTFGDAGSPAAIDDGSVVLLGGDASADSPACQRVISLTAVAIAKPPPFDVVIVADNSDSLSWSHADLAAGLQNVLSYVHGRDARFFLLTTTQYGASSQAAVSRMSGNPLVTSSSSIDGTAYTNPMTQYAQTCTSTAGVAIPCPAYPDFSAYDLHGAWTFTMPAPIAAITSAMTDAQIAAQQQALANAILNLGGGGASEEQPVCTLNRYITQTAAALPKNAVFIVLSDEDDLSAPSHCLAAYDYLASPIAGSLQPCTSNCDTYYTIMYATPAQTNLAYTCIPVDDQGNQHPELAVSRTLLSGYSADCSSITNGACSTSELARAANDCGAADVVQDCTRSCATSTATSECTLQRSSATPNLCTQSFEQNGTAYANMADYCTRMFAGYSWANCAVQGYASSDASTSYQQSEQTTPVVNATSTAEMIAHFRSSADGQFGVGGYQVETIQLDPSFSCAVGAGQGYGTTLRTLATSSADVFSLCGSYAVALEHVRTFADTLLQTTYTVSLASNETVEGVDVVTTSGSTRMLAPGDFTYDPATGTLQIRPGALKSGDSGLQVHVAHNCVPR